MPDKIERLVAATKTISDVPVWVERGADQLELSAPLEIDGVTVEGFTLRGRARKSLADREVIFQLEYHHAQIIGGAVARIEWKPLNVHSNKGVGPRHLRHVLQKGSHHHCFDLNWRQHINAQATAKAIEKTALTKEWVIERLMSFAKCADKDAASVRALELLGKELGMFVDHRADMSALYAISDKPMTEEEWALKWTGQPLPK